MTTSIQVTVALSESDAQLLGHTSTTNFFRQQPARFEIIGTPTGPPADDDVFSGGTMTWCTTASDILLLRGYEETDGFNVVLMWDLESATQGQDSYVMQSSRPFACL